MNISKARQELFFGKTIYDMNLKVADYGRVSTEKNDQINSLGNQINYFKDMISNVNNWIHVGSYIDEGISGTQVSKRENFLRMIEDAKDGKIDLILTKEVSRFARNTIDSIKYTQELLKYGVIVLFISDNINTIYPDSEFRLTLMASMAQDEVRKLSERVKFGIKRSIKDGKLGGGYICGYTKKNGKLTINEKEANIVQKLFSFYSTGQYGFKKIGEMLANEGYFTRSGKVYSDATLKKMLTNPRYKGYYTANLSEIEDYKTHRKKIKPKDEWIIYKDKNGIVPAIVSESLWNRANKIYYNRKYTINKNNLNKEAYLEESVYTSKLICSTHNCYFIRKGSGKRKNNPVWQCNEYLRHGLKGCKSPIIREKDLNQVFSMIISNIVGDYKYFIESFLDDYKIVINSKKIQNNKEKIRNLIIEKENNNTRLIELLLKNVITEKDYAIQKELIEKDIKNLTIELNTLNEMVLKKTKENLLNNIKNHFLTKRDLYKFTKIFIKNIFITKINNNRKNIKMEIKFNYSEENNRIEVITLYI